ncbi:cyclin-dependent kinase inhibitor 2c-related [Anaeramoeba flamelloides]|uniref:Cyclin-dependent kinase inhibitor 2c-related n=1 Tax=Anaeramoeba flamelloides TaxID=1746091 RepID=A0ABQ8X6U8_9EUKA|nr:cyclin-dependent kinase inhibitor 2c-related [Anaeramoeba flamelloides]
MSVELEKRINEFHKITKKSLKFSLEYLNKHSFDLDEALRSYLKPKEEEMIGSHFLTLVCQDDRKGLDEYLEKEKPKEEEVRSAIFSSISSLDIKMLKYLIEKVNIGTLNFQDPKTGLSPLHLSASLCRLEMVELLLSNGSDPWFLDHEGRLSNNVTKSYKCKTLICLKQKDVESSIIPTIELLQLLEGGDLKSIDKKTIHQMFHKLATFDSTRIYEHQTIIKTSGILSLFDAYGYKLIHRAIEYNNFSLVEFLLKVNKNEIHEKTKLVALTNSKMKKNNNEEDKKQQIEEIQEEEEEEEKDNNNKRKNKSPLQIAIENGNLLIVALLLINGANEKIIKKEKINDPFIKYLLNCFEENKNQSKFSYDNINNQKKFIDEQSILLKNIIPLSDLIFIKKIDHNSDLAYYKEKKVVVRRVWTNLSESGVSQLKNKTLGQFITANQFDNLVNWYGTFIDFNENYIPAICCVYEYIEGVSLNKLINKLKTQKERNKEGTGKKNKNENEKEKEKGNGKGNGIEERRIEIEIEIEEGEEGDGEEGEEEETKFTLQNLFKIACEILKTARFMALNSIFHNNLKPEKIIINRNGTPKIIYTGKIGSSKYYFQRQTTTTSSIFPIYYSIGLIFWEIYSLKKIPNQLKNIEQLFQQFPTKDNLHEHEQDFRTIIRILLEPANFYGSNIPQLILNSEEKFLRWSQEAETILNNENSTDGGNDKSSNNDDSNDSSVNSIIKNKTLFKHDYYYNKDFLDFDIKYSTIEEQFQLLKLKKLSELNKKNLTFLIYLNDFLQFIKENPRNIPSIELKIGQLYRNLSELDLNTDEPSDFLGVLFQCSIDPEELECGEDFDSNLFIATIEEVFFSENTNENEFYF